MAGVAPGVGAGVGAVAGAGAGAGAAAACGGGGLGVGFGFVLGVAGIFVLRMLAHFPGACSFYLCIRLCMCIRLCIQVCACVHACVWVYAATHMFMIYNLRGIRGRNAICVKSDLYVSKETCGASEDGTLTIIGAAAPLLCFICIFFGWRGGKGGGIGLKDTPRRCGMRFS